LARNTHIYIYTVCIRKFRQGSNKLYSHKRCIYTVLANPNHTKREEKATQVVELLGLAKTIHIYNVYTVILAGKLPYIRCAYTVLVRPADTI
jgi:hypothetical protein